MTSFYTMGATRFRLVWASLASMLALIVTCLVAWKCWRGNDVPEADANLDLASLLEFGNGSWIDTYHKSSSEQRDALELLFRCKIISVQEFAYSRANEEHIEECVWIATQMLRQKPLEEWIARRQQALQSFEDSITAVFAPRAQCGPDTLKEKPWSSRGRGE